jgi:hypothetical protein
MIFTLNFCEVEVQEIFYGSKSQRGNSPGAKPRGNPPFPFSKTLNEMEMISTTPIGVKTFRVECANGHSSARHTTVDS